MLELKTLFHVVEHKFLKKPLRIGECQNFQILTFEM